MTCKDCIHFNGCAEIDIRLNHNWTIREAENTICHRFKDKAKFVELPCKVGDNVYQTDGVRIYESKIQRIIYRTEGVDFDDTAIGKGIFLTKEEAEAKLKEYNND